MKESQSHYSKLTMFHLLFSSLRVKMSDIIKRKNKKKNKTILKRFLKLSRSSSFNSHEVIAQEAGAVANAVLETFLVTKKQQMS